MNSYKLRNFTFRISVLKCLINDRRYESWKIYILGGKKKCISIRDSTIYTIFTVSTFIVNTGHGGASEFSATFS